MDFKEYVATFASQEKAAKSLNMTQGMVSHILVGRYAISPNMAVNLEKKSNGLMTKHELCEDFR